MSTPINNQEPKIYLTNHEKRVAQAIRIENLEMNLELMSEFLEDLSIQDLTPCKSLSKTLLKQIKTLRENI